MNTTTDTTGRATPEPAAPPPFDPSDPAHLATFAGELAARTGRPFAPVSGHLSPPGTVPTVFARGDLGGWAMVTFGRGRFVVTVCRPGLPAIDRGDLTPPGGAATVAATVAEFISTGPPEGTGPRPATALEFDPTDAGDLRALCEHLAQRSGRSYTPAVPFGVPVDPGDPAAGSVPYPAFPTVSHADNATDAAVFVSFPTGDSFRVSGWVREGDPPARRSFDRSGRFHQCGPAALAWVLSRVIDRELAGDPPRACPGPATELK